MGDEAPKVIGRYALFGELASGGMATVHLGRLLGPVGFSRTVAIKRMHEQFAMDPEFVAMFLDEARLAARIRHPNVVQTLDVVAANGEVFLVLDLVHGEALARLLRECAASGQLIDVKIVSAIIAGALHGLHAAHEATGEDGRPLGIVHRDISPQNILVGIDGVARVLDFGIAKATTRMQSLTTDTIKGKTSYMAPEQLSRGTVTRRTDVFASGIVLWEALTARRLFAGNNPVTVAQRVLNERIQRPSEVRAGLDPAIDEIVLRALERDPERRYPTAREMALDLQRRVGIAPASDVGEWVEHMASAVLAERAFRVAEIESGEMVAMPLSRRDSAQTFVERRGPSDSEIGTRIIEGTMPFRLPLPPPQMSPAPPAPSAPVAAPPVSGPQPGTAAAPTSGRLLPVLLLLFGAVVLAAVGIWFASSRRAAARTPPRPPADTQAAPTLTPPDMTLPTVASTAVASAVPPAAAPVASAAAVKPQRRQAPSPGAASAPVVGSARRNPCDPPFVIDETGKHYKAECLP